MRCFPVGSIAVVWNAPSEVGLGRGAEIDGHDWVIRFNNYTTAGYEVDYGARTTHWATTFYPSVAQRTEQYAAIYCTIPAMDDRFIQGHLDPAIHEIPDYNHMVMRMIASDVRVIPWDVFAKIGPMSAGLSLLAWLYFDRGQSFRFVTCYGFNFFDATCNHHYFSDMIAPVGTSDHSREKEKALFDKMTRGEL